jgi:hypothetical protein
MEKFLSRVTREEAPKISLTGGPDPLNMITPFCNFSCQDEQIRSTAHRDLSAACSALTLGRVPQYHDFLSSSCYGSLLIAQEWKIKLQILLRRLTSF